MKTHDEVERLIHTGNGIIARREHPELSGTLDWLLRQRVIGPVLPGVYAPVDRVGDPDVRIRAALRKHPDAVLLGAAAARVSFWPKVALGAVEVALPRPAAAAAGFTFTRRQVPPELVVTRGPLRYATPALTAIDLAPFDCADAIDRALRKRVATLMGMYDALRLTPNRDGNSERRRLLVDSRDEPWSAAERTGHRLLRAARITGWSANLPVVLGGAIYFIDIAFGARKLAIEIDGRQHETDEDLFQSDRWRQNALVMAGWQVLRFTFEMLRDHPDVVIATIRRALRP